MSGKDNAELKPNCSEYYEAKYGCSHIDMDSVAYRIMNPYKGQTRNNKIRLGMALEKIKNTAEHYIEYCKNIPELDSKPQAEAVERLTCDIEEICEKLYNRM